MYCYYKNKRRKRRRRIILCLLFLLVTIILSSLYYDMLIVKNVVEYSRYDVESRVKKSLNSAMIMSVNNCSYEDLVLVNKDANGNIYRIDTNSLKVNKISTNLVAYAKKILDEELGNGVKLPSGVFSGIKFLSGYGKIVTYKTLSVGGVESEFVSSFVSAGINQTKHSLYLIVTVETFLSMPLNKQTITATQKVLICESIIVGKVPEIYFNNSK